MTNWVTLGDGMLVGALVASAVAFYAVAFYAVAFYAVLHIRALEREACAAQLEDAAACEESIAQSESRDGDDSHAAMRRQNAWALRRGACLLRDAP